MTNEPSRYGTGPDDLSEAEPERQNPREIALDELVALGQEMGGYDAPIIAVTEEMLKAVENYVIGCCNAMPKDLTEIYRAMAAVAPSSNLADRHAQQKKTICELLDDRDAALAHAEAAEIERDDYARRLGLTDHAWSVMAKERDDFRDALCATVGKLMVAEQRLAALEPLKAETDNHDYHGTKQDNKAVPDEVHERFHRSIGDVLAGRVIPEARRQMQEALKSAPKEKPEFPVRLMETDRRKVGG